MSRLGCGEAHHLAHWAHAGETSLGNLTLLCTHHHRLLHEGGFGAERDTAGMLVFTRAAGRVIPRSAEVREPRGVYRVFTEGYALAASRR